MWNVARLTSAISSSIRVISRLATEFGVGPSAARSTWEAGTPLASDNDKPAAPKTGAAILFLFRFDTAQLHMVATLLGNLLELFENAP
jgi:hypothetical protein